MERNKRADDSAIEAAVAAYLQAQPHDHYTGVDMDSLAVRAVSDFRELLRSYDRHEDTKALDYSMALVMKAIEKTCQKEIAEARRQARKAAAKPGPASKKSHHYDQKASGRAQNGSPPAASAEAVVAASTDAVVEPSDSGAYVPVQKQRSRSRSVLARGGEDGIGACELLSHREHGVLQSYRPRPHEKPRAARAGSLACRDRLVVGFADLPNNDKLPEDRKKK